MDSSPPHDSEAPVDPGSPPYEPLGAQLMPGGQGVRFAVRSRTARSISVGLYEAPESHRPTEVVVLEPGDADPTRFEAIVPGAGTGSIYAFFVEADDRSALPLLDPYARAVCGPEGWRDRVYGSDPNARPKSVVIDPSHDWRGDRHPRTPWSETIVYEAHVGSLTATHPDVPPEDRGTYRGIAAPAIIDHLQSLGVTAIEILPVQASVSEPHLAKAGRSNHWGYSPVALFAPDARFATGQLGEQVIEFRAMVRALHAAGIEVILDVVFNHTGEGGPPTPPLGLRGIDALTYFRTDPTDPSRMVDWTGTGNTLDVEQQPTQHLILDALRTWVREMHVDGFRFDLAATLAREKAESHDISELVRAIADDPLLSQAKLIAEPWDLGPGASFAGRFPAPFAEWNDRYRDTVRSFWRGDAGTASDLATCLAGSSDRFEASGRPPQSSVNFATAHDGFTLADLVAYDEKHNETNGEDNRDGTDDNRSWNHGVEGPTDDPAILAARDRTCRNLLATLFLSCGVPMLLAGDELGRTQDGNNNGYCLTNDRVPFDAPPASAERLELVRTLARIRSECSVFRHPSFFHGGPTSTGERDLVWLAPDGTELDESTWHDPERRVFAAHWHVDGDDALLLLNGSGDSTVFALPDGIAWTTVLDTARSEPGAAQPAAKRYTLDARSLAFLRPS